MILDGEIIKVFILVMIMMTMIIMVTMVTIFVIVRNSGDVHMVITIFIDEFVYRNYHGHHDL